MKISEKELDGLMVLVNKQDQHARVAGARWLEFLENSLVVLNKVQETRKEQADLGKTILRAHGLDPDKTDYTIDFKTREIKHLVEVDGEPQYVAVNDKEVVKEG